MKNSIHTLAVAALVAAFTTTAAHADSRMVTQGRAGYTVAPKPEQQFKGTRNATIVALAMEKPQQGPSRFQNAGRSGFTVVPNLNR
jgi:hypothetical protein